MFQFLFGGGVCVCVCAVDAILSFVVVVCCSFHNWDTVFPSSECAFRSTQIHTTTLAIYNHPTAAAGARIYHIHFSVCIHLFDLSAQILAVRNEKVANSRSLASPHKNMETIIETNHQTESIDVHVHALLSLHLVNLCHRIRKYITNTQIQTNTI